MRTKPNANSLQVTERLEDHLSFGWISDGCNFTKLTLMSQSFFAATSSCAAGDGSVSTQSLSSHNNKIASCIATTCSNLIYYNQKSAFVDSQHQASDHYENNVSRKMKEFPPNCIHCCFISWDNSLLDMTSVLLRTSFFSSFP